MTAERLPAYNRVLHAWIVTAALALALETPRRARPWALLGSRSASRCGAPRATTSAGHASRRGREPERWSPLLRA